MKKVFIPLSNLYFDHFLVSKTFLEDNEDINIIDNSNNTWYPTYIFINTNSDRDRKIHGENPTFKVVPNSNFSFTTSDFTESKRVNYFDGKTTRLKKIETYQVGFKCNYDMEDYPFDMQLCFMEIMVWNPRQFYVLLLLPAGRGQQRYVHTSTICWPQLLWSAHSLLRVRRH